MKKVIYISSVVLLAFTSCAREALVEDIVRIPEGERMVFSADLGPSVKSTLGNDGLSLVWEKTDKVCIISASNFSPSVDDMKYEAVPVAIDANNPSSASLISAKKRSFWVGGDTGNDSDNYTFIAMYPAQLVGTPSFFWTDDVNGYLPVTIPAEQDGVHFGDAQFCMDYAGVTMTRAQVLDGAEVAFGAFRPMTSLLNFKMTSSAGNVSVSKIEITAVYDSEHLFTYIAGGAAFCADGLIPASEVSGLAESTGKAPVNELTINLPTPITVGSDASEAVLASIIPTVGSYPVTLEFKAFDAENNLRLEGTATSPSEGFKGGKKYTFTVAMQEAETSVLAVDCVRNFPPEGGTYTGRIVSYAYVDGVKTAIDWELAAYKDASCTIPLDYSTFENWAHISSFTPSTTEVGVTMFEYAVNANTNIDLISQPDDVRAEIRAALQDVTPKGDKANGVPWNLAASDGSMTPAMFNSANCYVINAPGYYLLPCVAGNGIKNGYVNTTAYQPLSSYESDKAPLFVDYLGAQIVDPRIGHTSTGSGTPYAAYLLWEDAEGLISTSEDYAPVFSSDLPDATKGYLETIRPYALPVIYDSATGMWGIVFEVEPENIDQGNAVIAVVDEQARIMWSWHIWATDYNPYQSVIPVRSYWSDGDYNYMRRNLGWVAVGKSNEIKYKDNAMYVKVWQVRTNPDTGDRETIPESEGGRSVVIPLLQEGTHLFDADIQYGYGPYYQAGRKDPLTPGMRGSDGFMHDVLIFGAVKALTGKDFVAENRAATLADGIQYPYTYFYQYTDGGFDLGSGGWFTDNTSNKMGSLWNNVELDGELSIAKVIVRKDPTVKTVYDPNPAGFAMPPMDAGGTFFAFFTGGKYENYLVNLSGADGALLRAKYVSLLVSASEYGCLYYASLADKQRDDAGSGPVNMGFMPQVGRRYNQLNGQFQTSAFVDVENNGSHTTYINEMANTPNCGGYYSNYVVRELAPVMLCAYPYMYYGFLTVSSSALPVRSVVEEVRQ